MIKTSIQIIACCLLPAVISAAAVAEAVVQGTDLRLLIVGNTLEGRYLSAPGSVKMYFHPSGKVLEKDSSGKVNKGRWQLREGEKLCMTYTIESCYSVRLRGDGQYDLYLVDGDKVISIDRVILGNPERLDALTGNN